MSGSTYRSNIKGKRNHGVFYYGNQKGINKQIRNIAVEKNNERLIFISTKTHKPASLMFSLNFSSAGKRPFMASKTKNRCQRCSGVRDMASTSL